MALKAKLEAIEARVDANAAAIKGLKASNAAQHKTLDELKTNLTQVHSDLLARTTEILGKFKK